MAAPTSGIVRAKWTNEYYNINGRKITIVPANFQVSDDGVTWVDLQSFGSVGTMTNCSDAGSTSSNLVLMVVGGVSSFSFKLSNDTSNTLFTMLVKDSITLPNISITRVKSAIGSGNSNLGALNTSAAINLSSPRVSSSVIYNPYSQQLPTTVGRPLKTQPYTLGEWIGYCHTAEQGFKANNFNNLTVSYGSTYNYSSDVIKNQIPVAGDTDTSKWNNIKLVYPDTTYSNLNFNNIFTHTHTYNGAVNQATAGYSQNQELRIYYNDSNLMQTLTRTVTFQGRNDIMTVTLTVTSSSAALRRINVSFSIYNKTASSLNVSGTYTVKAATSNQTGTTSRTLGTLTILGGYQTATLTGYASWAVDEFTPNPTEGQTMTVIVYKDGSAFESTTTTLQA